MLDATLDAIMKQMAANPTPKLWEVSAPQARSMFLAMRDAFDAKGTPIGKVDSVEIPGPGGPLAARIYTPVGLTGRVTPACVYYHGGGWVIGDLDTHDAICRMLANESGCRIVAVDYRLAPENKFPAAFEDAYAVLVWTEANAMDHSINPNRLAVAGDSAGGNLAAAVALHAKAKGTPKLAYQVLIYPVTQARAQTASMNDLATGYFLEKASMDWFCDQYLEPGADLDDPRLSPLAAKDVTGVAPAFVLTAGFDPLKDEGKQYAMKLKAAGVQVEFVEYDSMVHGFLAMGGLLPQAAQAAKEIGKALARALA
ncbi:Carboxylesterase NlhH [Alphaproteobacteria bacterium SO-S41]|nr:Carboxylesterase NlhH [Alphaproteobacteria bacterium SO-S41]